MCLKSFVRVTHFILTTELSLVIGTDIHQTTSQTKQSGHSREEASDVVSQTTSHPPQSGHSESGASSRASQTTSHPLQLGHSGAEASDGVSQITSHSEPPFPQSGHSRSGAFDGVSTTFYQSGHSGSEASGRVTHTTSHSPQSRLSADAGACAGIPQTTISPPLQLGDCEGKASYFALLCWATFLFQGLLVVSPTILA